MAADTDHARIVERLTDTHEQRLLNSLQQLEDRLADYATNAPTTEGQLFDLAWSVQARPDIEQIFRETYLTEVDSIVREYATVLSSIEDMFNEYDTFTGVAPEIISNLQRISFQGFEDIAVTFTDQLANDLYQSTLVGRPRSEAIKNLRQSINGVYIQSDQAEVARLVDIANSGTAGAQEAIRQLHQIYAADRVGNNMRKYATQMVHDSVMQFDASVNVAAGREVGATEWKYYGSVIRDTREWCERHAGKTYTEEEIREMWANNSWAGKSAGDPFIVRGGYNCRHHWRPVFETEG